MHAEDQFWSGGGGVCDFTGEVEFQQPGPRITGELSFGGLCVFEGVPPAGLNFGGEVRSGDVEDTALVFEVDDGGRNLTCRFSGILSGSPPETADGSLACGGTGSGQFSPAGTWTAERIA